MIEHDDAPRPASLHNAEALLDAHLRAGFTVTVVGDSVTLVHPDDQLTRSAHRTVERYGQAMAAIVRERELLQSVNARGTGC